MKEAQPDSVELPPLLRLSNDGEKPLTLDQEFASVSARYTYSAHYIKLDVDKACVLAILDDRLVIFFNETGRNRIIMAHDVVRILSRGILHRPRAIEVFSRFSRSFLFAFDDQKSFDVLRRISNLRGWGSVRVQTQPSPEYFQSLQLTQKWMNRELPTFEYLMALNFISGRTFNDARMYPVFPWIIKDYSSDALDLRDENVFRDLSKPVGAIDEHRLQQLKTRCLPPDEGVKGRYLYSSTYSSPLCIFIWMVRVEPFTSMHIQAQNGRFDHPSRQFASVKTAYELSTTSIGDYREIIPEFFYDDAFLMNKNEFNLGTARGEVLNHVELPPWSRTATEFVYLNRKALESEFISSRIHHWIDLIWGYKQTGKDAADADNLFYPYLYESVWSLPLADEPVSDVTAALDCCGQIPQQLFQRPHPARLPLRRPNWLTGPMFLDSGLDFLRLHGLDDGHLVCSDLVAIHTMSVSFKKKDLPRLSCTQWNTRDVSLVAGAALSSTVLIGVVSTGELFYTSADRSTLRLLPWDHGTVVCFSGSGSYLCAGGSETSVTLFHASPSFEVVYTFPTFRDAVVCCTVNASFDLAVVGARDSTLFLIALSRRTITSVLNLEGYNPLSVLITDGWGFIVVYGLSLTSREAFIEVLTVNGEQIRKTKVNFEVQCWSTWKSRSGFDYLIVAPKRGQLRACEVFYLDFELIGLSTRADTIFYSPQFEVMFVGQMDGRILMIPFHFRAQPEFG
jgi:hypothetical protein